MSQRKIAFTIFVEYLLTFDSLEVPIKPHVSAQAAVTRYHRLGGLVLEAEPWEIWRFWDKGVGSLRPDKSSFLLESLSHCVLTGLFLRACIRLGSGRQRKQALWVPLQWQQSRHEGPTLTSSSDPNYLPKAPFSKCYHTGGYGFNLWILGKYTNSVT